ncbi:S8 family serine peptidase [Thalassobellus sediminis]|uniref:S8 family serine peptidase n=1 Tax=Thalassobellus sediminis TaxID=3367753 RepID=UPI00379E6960
MKGNLFLLFVLCFQFALLAQQDAWVYFSDKQNVATSIANPISILSQKAIDRKALYGVIIDERDVPVNESYIYQLKITKGITVLAKSKWFNAIHVRGLEADINALASLSFVNYIDFADKNLNTSKQVKQKKESKFQETFTVFNYGNTANQIEMFNGDQLHLIDYTGTGMTVAVLDSGFPNVNIMSSFQRLRNSGLILGNYDFVNREEDVFANTKDNHGTWVLSTMAGYVENEYVGTAPDASYYLFITEDVLNENPVEESYWVEAVERADSLGVDVINTSLGYGSFYDNANYNYNVSDYDGQSIYMTKAANIAFEKGMLLVVSAGNEGSLGVNSPADSPNVLSIGAVNSTGRYASFSSEGSAIQPTQKPDVAAQGQASYVINPNDVIGTLNGTSFSSPIIAGGITCLWQALPNKTNAEIMQLVRESASQYNNPDYFLGYGIPDLQLALNTALSVNDVKGGGDLRVYPNPTTGKIFFKFPDREEELSVSVYDILGKEVKEVVLTTVSNQIDLSSLPRGIYLSKIESKKFSKTIKLVKN